MTTSTAVPGRFTLSHCTACDLYYQTPRPALDVIPTYYPPTYAVYGDDPVVGWLFRITYWLDARRVARLIGPRRPGARRRAAGRAVP